MVACTAKNASYALADTFSAFDQLIDENLGEFPNIDITGTGAFTCDVIDEDLETTLGLLHLLDGDVNLDLLREDEEIVHELDERFMS